MRLGLLSRVVEGGEFFLDGAVRLSRLVRWRVGLVMAGHEAAVLSVLAGLEVRVTSGGCEGLEHLGGVEGGGGVGEGRREVRWLEVCHVW